MPPSELPVYPFPPSRSVGPGPEAARLRAAGPIAPVRLATGEEACLLTGYHDVRAMLADQRFSRAAGAEPGAPTVMPNVQGMRTMFNMDPPDHTRLRRLVSKAFTAPAVERLTPQVTAIVAALLDAMIAAGPPAELRGALSAPLPMTVTCALLGIPEDDRPALFDFVNVTTALAEVPPAEVHRVVGRATERITALLDKRRAVPEDDLLTALVQARDEDGDRLSQDELLDTVILLFGTGQEATANHLLLSVVALGEHRDQWDLLVARPELVPGAVEELLRYVRVIDTALGRIATTDVTLPGGRVPAGAAVFPVYAAANRDPRVFDRPEELDITRPDAQQHIAFAYGPHYCLGAPLARLELRTALTALVTRLPGLRVAVDTAALDWNTDSVMGGLRSLPVTW